jgi:hypothetical protein
MLPLVCKTNKQTNKEKAMSAMKQELYWSAEFQEEEAMLEHEMFLSNPPDWTFRYNHLREAIGIHSSREKKEEN